MDIKNLETAAKLHDRRVKLQHLVDNINLLITGKDEDGDTILADSNNFTLFEEDSEIELDFTELNVGKKVLESIKDVVVSEQMELLKAVEVL